METKKLYFNYLVLFSDETIKTGVSSQPIHRLQDYYQEASSHHLKVCDFYITSPTHKKISLEVESEFCKFYDYLAIEGHKERFCFDQLMREISTAAHGQFNTSKELQDFVCRLECEWGLKNVHRMLIDRVMSTKQRNHALEYLKRELIDIAQNGIKPTPSHYDWAVNLCSHGYRYAS